MWFGSIVVAFHDVWSGIPMLLTLLGSASGHQRIILFCFQNPFRRISYVERDRAHLYAWGVFLLLRGLSLKNRGDLWSTSSLRKRTDLGFFFKERKKEPEVFGHADYIGAAMRG